MKFRPALRVIPLIVVIALTGVRLNTQSAQQKPASTQTYSLDQCARDRSRNKLYWKTAWNKAKQAQKAGQYAKAAEYYTCASFVPMEVPGRDNIVVQIAKESVDNRQKRDHINGTTADQDLANARKASKSGQWELADKFFNSALSKIPRSDERYLKVSMETHDNNMKKIDALMKNVRPKKP